MQFVHSNCVRCACIHMLYMYIWVWPQAQNNVFLFLFVYFRLFAFCFANILFARSVTWCYRQWQWHRHSNGSMSSRDRNYYPVNTPNVHHSNVKINKIVEYSLFCSAWAYASVHYRECEHTCTCLPIEIEQYVVLTFDQN